MLHDTHFTFTTCFSLSRSPSVSLSLCVCQMGFMYLIYLGEWATVETKALRHILLARTLFKKTDTHVALQAHSHATSCTWTFFQEFCRYRAWHNWFNVLILYSLIQYLQRKWFLELNKKNALFSYCKTYFFYTMQWL